MNEPKAQRNGVIFGAAGGIGSALAGRLFSGGWRLALSARHAEQIDASLAGQASLVHEAEATDGSAVEKVFTRALEKWGRIDGVVNCCGSLLLKPLHLVSSDEWSRTIAANLTTSFHILQGAALRMKALGGGSIVLIASAAAERGMINHEAISAAKAGVIGLARSAAATYARYGVRVNCVAPGLVRTPLSDALVRNEMNLKASLALHPLGRLGEPSEVASAIAWLLDAEQGWVTGQVIGVDGGLGSIQPRPI